VLDFVAQNNTYSPVVCHFEYSEWAGRIILKKKFGEVCVARCIALSQKGMHFLAVVGSDVDSASFIISEAPKV
jgi:hypothetical protein